MEDYKYKIVHAVKDHTVSNQTFGLYHDEKTDMLVTFPRPKPENLDFFYESKEYISHTDSNFNFFDKVYQIVKSYTLKSKINLIKKHHAGVGNILDIGCGTGDFLVVGQKSGWQTTGVETNIKAKLLAENKNITVFETSQNLENQSFDIITMWHVLEHVYDVDAQISELKRLLKPNGTIIIAVPNYKSFDAKFYGRHWAAFDVPRHLSHFSKSSIKIIFERQGMFVKKIIPMRFDSFYVSLLSEKHKTGSININGLWIGLKSNWKARKSKQFSSQIYVIKVK